MNHANHSIALVYVYDGGELDVGTVACVPRKGEIVVLPTSNGELHAWHAHRVEQVEWRANEQTAQGVRFTIVRCSVSRCP